MEKRARYVLDYLGYGRLLQQVWVRLFQDETRAAVVVVPMGTDEPVEHAPQIAAAVLAEQPWLRAYLEGRPRSGIDWYFLYQQDLVGRQPRDSVACVVFRTHRFEAQAPWETRSERRIGRVRRIEEVDWPEVERLIGEPVLPEGGFPGPL